jgi:hypothetical protein
VLLGAAVFAIIVLILAVRRAMRGAQSDLTTLRDATAGDRWGQMKEHDYLNGKHGVCLRGFAMWISKSIEADFASEGGFLVLQAPDGTALLTFASAPLAPAAQFAQGTDRFRQEWRQRAINRLEEQRLALAGKPIKPVQLAHIDGETDVLRFEFSRADETVGNVWALHQGDEHVMTYWLRHPSSVRIEEVLANWKWFLRLRTDETGLPYRRW